MQVLDRARKAEAEVVSLKAQLKSETSTSKKSLRDMEAALAEAQARSQKCEREYATLRDSLKGLVASFKADHDGLREEMRKREERLRREAEEVRKKYVRLVEEVKRDREADGRGMGEVLHLKEEAESVRKEVEEGLKAEVQRLRAEVDRSNKESEGAIQTAKCVSSPLSSQIRTDKSPTETSRKSSLVYADSCVRAAPRRQTPHKHNILRLFTLYGWPPWIIYMPIPYASLRSRPLTYPPRSPCSVARACRLAFLRSVALQCIRSRVYRPLTSFVRAVAVFQLTEYIVQASSAIEVGEAVKCPVCPAPHPAMHA